jgi:hypothetical protein
MKRFLASLLFALPLAAQTLDAGPLSWAKHHPTATRVIGLGVSAGVHAVGLHACRTRGVEVCDGHYGAAWGIFAAATATNATMQFVGAKLGGKEGAAISAFADGIQLGHGIYEWRKPHETEKPDLSRVVLLRR